MHGDSVRVGVIQNLSVGGSVGGPGPFLQRGRSTSLYLSKTEESVKKSTI